MSSLNYQGIGPRLVAQIVDGIVLLILYFILGAAMFGGFTFEVFGFAALSFMGAYMLLFLLYFIVLEGTFGACGIGPAVIRNVLRIVDALPFFYIIGLILISRSDKKQRLGDSLAKTVVVKSSQAQPIAAPAQAKAFCTNCGAELPGGTSFCPKCGAKQ